MIACIQRVGYAEVKVGGEVISRTEDGLLVFLGVEKGDTEDNASKIASKIANLRIFQNCQMQMSLSVVDIQGDVMVVSQFTLAADTTRGNRPDFMNAAPPEEAKRLYELVISRLKSILGDKQVQSGRFGADMKISLMNDGPVTILLKR